MNRLWPDTAVEEANLTQNIFEVRKALGEVPGEQRFIATVARRGYRFVAEVRAIGDEASARDDLAAGDRHAKVPLVAPERFARRTVIYAGVAAAIVLSLLGTWLYVASRRPAPVVAAHLVVARAQPDPTDLRRGSADRRELVTRRPAGGLRVEQRRELRHLGAERRWRRAHAGDELRRPTRRSRPGRRMANVWSFVPNLTAVASSRSTSKVVPCGESRQTDGAPRGCPMVATSCSWTATRPHAAFIVAADGGEAPRRILETELSRIIWAASAIHPEGRISVIAPSGLAGAGFFVADRTNSRLSAVDTSAAAPLGLLEPDVIRNLTWNAIWNGVDRRSLERRRAEPVACASGSSEPALANARAPDHGASGRPGRGRFARRDARGIHERAGVDPRLAVPVRRQQRPAHGRRQGTDRRGSLDRLFQSRC